MPKKGDTVVVSYTGKTVDGKVFDSTQGRDPFTFVLGEGEVIDGFDEAVSSMVKGEKKTVAIPCSKAYGRRDPRKVQPIKLGETINIMIPSGQVVPARITDVRDGKAIIDFNPQMAGEDLVFDLELVDVVTQDEIDGLQNRAGSDPSASRIIDGITG